MVLSPHTLTHSPPDTAQCRRSPQSLKRLTHLHIHLSRREVLGNHDINAIADKLRKENPCFSLSRFEKTVRVEKEGLCLE